MIYFLLEPGTDKVSIRYYRTVGIFYAQGDKGLEALAAQKGSREVWREIDILFAKYRGIGANYYLAGELDKRLGWPRTLRDMTDVEMAVMYSMPHSSVKQAKKRAEIKKVTRQNASRVYDAYMEIVRARKSGGLM
jgi:hypothetical protein